MTGIRKKHSKETKLKVVLAALALRTTASANDQQRVWPGSDRLDSFYNQTALLAFTGNLDDNRGQEDIKV